MRFWKDRIAVVFSVVAIALMILTIVWHINPAECSVVPRFLTGNPAGVAVICVLLATCMPAWILAVSLSTFIPFTEHMQYVLACAIMIVLQCIVFFLIGKLVSICIRKMRKKITSNQASDATSGSAPGAKPPSHQG